MAQEICFRIIFFQQQVRMYAEYDPISLFERNSCFRVNIQIFSKNWCFSMLQMNFKMSIFGYRSRFLTKFSTLLGFSQSENRLRAFSNHEKISLTLIQGKFELFQGYKKLDFFEKVWILTRKHEFRSKRPIGSYSAYTLTHY